MKFAGFIVKHNTCFCAYANVYTHCVLNWCRNSNESLKKGIKLRMTIEIDSKSYLFYLILVQIKILAGNDDDMLIANEQLHSKLRRFAIQTDDLTSIASERKRRRYADTSRLHEWQLSVIIDVCCSCNVVAMCMCLCWRNCMRAFQFAEFTEFQMILIKHWNAFLSFQNNFNTTSFKIL